MGINKRGQVTIFIIIGIVLITGIISLFLLSKNEKANSNQDDRVSNIQREIDKCLENISIEGLNQYGLNELDVGSHITQNFPNCINSVISGYQDEFNRSSNLKSTEVNVDNDFITVKIDFAVLINENGTQKIDNFQKIFPRYSKTKIEHNENCQVLKDYEIYSFDNKFKIKLNKNTEAYKLDGTCLDEIGIYVTDPVLDYGYRATSLTRLAYEARPFGANFIGNVQIELNYNDFDYQTYLESAKLENQYLLVEQSLKIEYYDKSLNNFFVYKNQNNDLEKNIIIANTDQFYGSQLIIDKNCYLQKITIIESFDKRANVFIYPETKMIKKDNSCINSISITKQEKSSASTFGVGDYIFEPAGAKFSPEILVTYKYTQEEADNPVFKYGQYNWQDLLTGNWSPPTTTSTSRQETDLRLAYLENDIFKPYPTTVDTIKKEIIGLVSHFTTITTKTNCEDTAMGSWENVVQVKSVGETSNSGEVKYTLEKKYSCTKNVILNTKISSGDTVGIVSPELPKVYLPSEIKAGEETIVVASVKDANAEKTDRENWAYVDIFLELWGSGLTSKNKNLKEIKNQTEFCLNYPEAYNCLGPEWTCVGTSYTGTMLEACEKCAGWQNEMLLNGGWGTDGEHKVGVGTFSSLEFCTATITKELMAEECVDTSVSDKFLWKPEADSGGKLVVLHSFGVSGAEIYDLNDNLIERGSSKGPSNCYGDTIRFSKKGGQYPDNIYVKAGSRKCYIEESSNRIESCVPLPVKNETRLCTENDWNYTITNCTSPGIQTKLWIKTNLSCSNGIQHPQTEYINCTYIPPVIINQTNETVENQTSNPPEFTGYFE